jgi:capsular exopolysaccharide synthesis family protein
MDLSQHFLIIWRRRWTVLLASILVAGLVFAWRNSQPRVYKATAVLSVTKARDPGGAVSATEVQFLAQSYGALAQTLPVAGAAARATVPPLRVTPAAAASRVSIDSSSSPGFINLSAIGASPEEAQAFTTSLGGQLVQTVQAQQADQKNALLGPITAQMDSLQTQISALPQGNADRTALQDNYNQLLAAKTATQLQAVDQVQIVSPARSSGTPVSPKPARDAVLVFIVALIVNAELAVGLEVLSDRFSATDQGDEIERVTGLPVLARIPRGGEEDYLEEVRTLRTNLLFTSTGQSLRTVAVVGVEPGSGKSFTCKNLAVSVADLEIPVLLVDGDLRRPTLHEAFGVVRAPGLSEVLNGMPIENAAIAIPDSSWLRLLPAGAPVADPAGLLRGSALRSATSQPTWVELVLIDTPASIFFADAFAIASQCDATLIVINGRKTRRRAVRKLIGQLHQVNATPIGVVLNWTSTGIRSSQYYTNRRSPAFNRRS